MPDRLTFPRSRRLHSREDFSAVYDAKVRESRGPLLIYARPNALPYPRLGMSTSRKVGAAPRRNRIRRLIREAFRHLQHDLPPGYDLLVVLRPHEPLGGDKYRELLSSAAKALHATWERRANAAK
jgi:ribonuclease P protein component